MPPLPPLRNILTQELNQSDKPSESYTNVVTQAYPLRADRRQLEVFCDRYLNLKRDSNFYKGTPFYFRPAASFVLLQVAHYGSISDTEPDYRLTFSQNEVAFGFPVEWYDVAGQSPVFRDWYMFYPFIFVDDSYSMAGGRQVYGWPKASVKIESVKPDIDVEHPVCLASVSRQMYPVRHTSETDRQRFDAAKEHLLYVDVPPAPDARPTEIMYLQVFQRRPFLTGLTGIGAALSAIPRAAGGLFGAMSTGLKGASDLLSGAQELRDLPRLFAILSRFFGYASDFSGRFTGLLGGRPDAGSGLSIVTLKQFRDTEYPDFPAYLALVSSRINVKRIQDGGPLFDQLSMDLTGGIEIKVLRTAGSAPPSAVRGEQDGQPPKKCDAAIGLPDPIQQLGIECSAMDYIEGCPAYVLRPVMPVWSRLDFHYGAADRQYWRTKWTGWSQTDKPEPPPVENVPFPPFHIPIPIPIPPPGYNEIYGGGGSIELKGPFIYRDFSARIFRLDAQYTKLNRFVNDYLSNPFYTFSISRDTFRRASVWVMLGNFTLDRYFRLGGDPIPFCDKTMMFMVPGAIVSRADHRKSWPAVFAAYQFTDADWDYITENEVFGRFALRADFVDPGLNWMASANPKAVSSELLRIRAEIFVDRKADNGGNGIVEKREKVAWVDRSNTPWPPPGGPLEGRRMIERYKTQNGLGLLDAPFYVISLKQVADALHPGSAGYQEVVAMPAYLDKRKFELEPPINFRLVTPRDGEFRLFRIAPNLGLDQSGKYDNRHPLRVSGILRTGDKDKAGITLAWRAGSGGWQKGGSDLP